MGRYESKNAENVLAQVERHIALIESGVYGKFRIREVYDDLSIFDWWNEYLSAAQLKDMRKFLKEAIKLGYTGYVCFKVGAAGCANGMWAHKAESEDGYSPKGEFLYKSFVSTYNYWDAKLSDGSFLAESRLGSYDAIKTIKQLETALKSA